MYTINKIAVYFLALIMTVPCQPKNPENNTNSNQNKNREVNGVTISAKLLSELDKATQKDHKAFTTVKWELIKTDTGYVNSSDTLSHGIVYNFIPEKKARQIFMTFHEKIQKEGNYLFLTNLDVDSSYKPYYDIAIIQAENQLEVIKFMNTNGVNYEISNEDVVKKFKQWDKEVGLEVVVADKSRVEAKIKKLPDDLKSFTQEIYEFCPDVISQGYGSMEKMRKAYKKSKYFWLWWD